MIHDPRDDSDETSALAQGADRLPPIPDGGLAEVMPSWLRDAPDNTALASNHAKEQPTTMLNASLNPAEFITEADLPGWLRQLSETPSTPPPPGAEAMRDHLPTPAPSAQASRSIAPLPATPSPATTLTNTAGRSTGFVPASSLANKPEPLPRREPESPRPPAVATVSPQAPVPEVRQEDTDWSRIVGIGLALIAAGIVVYLVVRSIL